ncbi:MAG: hypothetical protein GY869_17320 [Planctomycetes bacterium]|nr:hypothetical protein [Planctomycetota bacterium]
MLRIGLLVIILGLGILVAGCQTTTGTPQQNTQKYSRIMELNRMMIMDDIESFWLMDRPSNLSYYRVPQENIK